MAPSEFDRKIEKLIITHEGLRLKPYRCTAGKLTIGVGRNIEDNGITKDEAMVMLRNDITRTRFSLERALPCFLGLSPMRQMVMIDMCFNLGLARFLGFRRMIAALEAKEYEQAADEMLNSTWANQVGVRATNLATMMREG